MNEFVFAAVQGGPQLKPIYDVVDYPKNPYPFWVGVILAGLTMGVIGVFVWQHYFRASHTKGDQGPEELALNALIRLKRAKLIEVNKSEEFLTELSKIVRAYIEAQFNIHAPDMTTEEFFAHVKNNQKLSDQEKSDLKAFMDFCDQVKFAKMNPAEQEVAHMAILAENFIKSSDNLQSN